MKTLPVLIFGLLYLCVASIGVAQNISSQPIQVTVPPPTPYAITAQDANSRVWGRTVYELDPSGKVVPRQEQYHELASGLNHLVNGQYMASSEEINILLNGTAVATNGQHQARFPGDIYQGEIQLLTPDGQLLQSRPLALAYFDGTNTVVIAELTNSVGLVSGNNQVIYPDAFNTLSGFKADLRYTYTKAGFSQDVILRTQPPTPESLGLNPDTARLQIMTEFFSAPQPTVATTALPTQAGISLDDESLGFGTMQMVPGRAFLMGQNAQNAGALVSKHWVIVNGRQVLIEEVPVDAILEGLAALPMTAMNSSSNKNSHTASRQLTLPPQRLVAKNTSKTMMLAKADLPAKGFVLDYQTVTGTFTNYTFQGDSTFYISGSLILLGNSTFEGGAVIKYATNGTISMTPGPVGTPSITWKGSAYRPVIFTGIDDNSVGGSIAGSTGNPTGHYYGNGMLTLSGLSSVQTLTGLRMSFAKTAITFSGASANVYNAQFVNCQYGISGGGANIALRNVLYASINTNFYATSGGFGINAQNVTINGSKYLLVGPSSPSGVSLALSNCICANVTNLSVGFATPGGSYNGFYNAPNFGSATTTNTFYPFQTVGGGRYYLTNGCAFTNAGTTNIDSTLLASLKQKTTYPPISYTNVTFAVPTTFSPQAQRDIDIPDLGYHYDPLDYVFGGCVANSNFTFTAGTAVGWFRTTSGWMHAGYGIDMGSNVTVRFAGTATAPTYWVRLNTVQEQDYTAGFGQAGIETWVAYPNLPTVSGNFLRCSAMAGEQRSYFSDDYGTIQAIMMNSEFWGGSLDGYGDVFLYTNCLMQRVDMEVWTGNTYGAQILRNCTFIGGNFSMQRASGGALPVSVRDSAFDGTSISTADFYGSNSSVSDYDYNAYTNSTYPFSIGGTHDVHVTGSFNWQSSWFGNYYQPTASSLIDKGYTTADQVGLYHFTSQTNQTVEGFSTVDIGYHYVAVDANGNPIDTDGDGFPDYIEDANGNGLVDSGETDWQSATDFGLKIWITRPRTGSTIP